MQLSINVTKFRNAISELRMASNRLEIEAGRWVRINERVPVNERKCRLYNVMEDEYHFVIECHRYNGLRKKYIPKYYFQRPSMYKFIELVTTENNTLMKKFVSFVYQALKFDQKCFKHNKHTCRLSASSLKPFFVMLSCVI